MSFLGEIKRRKVFQVAAVYAVVAWLIIQVIDVVSEPLSLPGWLDTVVIVLLAAGFPIAVVLAWAFDFTPRGIESDSAKQTAGASPRLQGQSISLVIQSLVLLAVAVLLLDQYLLEPRSSPLEGASMSIVAEEQVYRFDYTLPTGQFLRDTAARVIALSPDGRQFVYNADDGLYLRTMDALEAQLIPGTEPFLYSMVFSPDGQSLAYMEDAEGELLKRITINGSAAVTIGEPVGFQGLYRGMSWQPDGTILYGGSGGIYRVSANGGRHELIIPLENPDRYGAELLPDGDSLLFSLTSNSDWEAAQIVIQSLSTGERTVLFEGGSDVRYLPTGHLIYVLGSGLFARAFDLDSLTVSGGAVPLLQGVMQASETTGAANYDVSENGTLVYIPSTAPIAARSLVWVDREGRETRINAPLRNYIHARISPDGTKIALEVRDQEYDIYTWDLARERLTRLTFDPGPDRFPVWLDGERIAYQSRRSEGGDQVLALNWQRADGAGTPVRMAENLGLFPTSALPEPTRLLLSDDDIGVIREGEARATLLLDDTRFQERNPEISPDGHWMAYASDESGTEEVYVRPFPDIGSGRWQVSSGGGTQPLWSRDGQELFYRDGDAIMAVAIETDPTFLPGNPELVFEGDYATSFGGRTYDVSLDGERFLMMKEAVDTSAPTRITVVLNWVTELERMVPTE